jgi:hypothetical protein
LWLEAIKKHISYAATIVTKLKKWKLKKIKKKFHYYFYS